MSAALLVLAACLALAACGGSSKSSSSTAVASATTSTGFAGSTGGFGRFKALRECLQKNGVTLPKRTPGQPPQGGGFFRGGTGATLPNGVSRSQMEAALKKCGGAGFGFGAGARLRRFNNPAYKQALAKFATCMREHGVNVPAPNTSGSGPIFNTQGINTSSTQFTNAEAACRSDLRGAFRAGGPPGGAGAPSSPPAGGGEG